MEIISIDDKTGIMEIDLTNNEQRLLVEYAINNILRELVEGLESGKVTMVYSNEGDDIIINGL